MWYFTSSSLYTSPSSAIRCISSPPVASWHTRISEVGLYASSSCTMFSWRSERSTRNSRIIAS